MHAHIELYNIYAQHHTALAGFRNSTSEHLY
jgi:hypothetical protein